MSIERSVMYKLVLFIIALVPSLSMAEEITSDFSIRNLISDGQNYFTAPLRWDQQDWLWFGGTVMTVAAIQETDEDTRSIYANRDRELNGFSADIAKVGNSWGELPIAASVVLGLYSYGALTDNFEHKKTSYNMLKAGIYAGISTQMLKYAVGRDRPNATASDESYSGSGHAFPSGHTSFAFALSTAYAESVDNPSIWRRLGAYGLATATAYARVHDNKHWTSDVVAGAALGIATGLFVTNKHKSRKSGGWDIIVSPLPGGGSIGGGIEF